MTKDEISQLARTAGFVGMDGGNGCLRRFAELVAAAELRRLHAENTTLQQGYDAARLEIDGLRTRVQELERERDGYKAVCDEWLDKTEWVQQTSHPRELGMHRRTCCESACSQPPTRQR